MSAAHPQAQSPLFRLPPEIRLQIYTHLLLPPDLPTTDPTCYPFQSSLTKPKPARAIPSAPALRHPPGTSSAIQTTISLPVQTQSQSSDRILHPAVLCTCRVLNAEATPLLYDNIITAHPLQLGRLCYWRCRARSLPAPVLHRVTRWEIFVRVDAPAPWTVDEVREWADGARELRVYCVVGGGGGDGGGGGGAASRLVSRPSTQWWEVLKVFEAVRGVGRVRVYGNMLDQRYRCLLERTMELPLGTFPISRGQRKAHDGAEEEQSAGLGQHVTDSSRTIVSLAGA